ncbi:MAG: Rpn family recombination-promoting nuclease/putative transposase [Lachnospiraceae bacterium]
MDQEKELLEARYERYRNTLKNLTLMSDILIRNVLKDERCTEYILQVILGDKELTVVDQKIQADYKNLHGRSAVLDCIARDRNGRVFNVEIQQDDAGAQPKRARYHLGLVDTNVLNTGEFFDQLPEIYIVFITQKDVLGYGLPLSHIDRMIKENGKCFCDESHFIYIDSSKHEDTELGRLMKDFHCKDVSEMQDSVLAERVRELKETAKGVNYMCREMEEIRYEGREEGRAEGREEGRMEEKKETAKRLQSMGMSLEQIAQALVVNVQMVRTGLREMLL